MAGRNYEDEDHTAADLSKFGFFVTYLASVHLNCLFMIRGMLLLRNQGIVTEGVFINMQSSFSYYCFSGTQDCPINGPNYQLAFRTVTGRTRG